MKSLAELQALRDEMKTKIGVRKDSDHRVRVVVGMATCGIAAGARPVLSACIKEMETRGLTDVVVSQTGCIGICQFEPVMEVFDEDGSKTTYVHVTPEKVEYTIGANAK